MANLIGPRNPFIEFARSDIDQSLPARFEQQAACWPERVAVRADGAALTYAALDRAANRLAHAVLAQLGPEVAAVGLLLEPGLSAVVGLMGLLKAGKIWVPLDPSQPAARLEHLTADAGLSLIVGDTATSRLPTTWGQPVPTLNLDDLAPNLPDTAPGLRVDPDAPAFILYTSGSTGQPKGVPQTHRNILHAIRLHTNSLHICADDRLVLLTAFNTLTGSTATFRALMNGAAVYPYYLKRHGLGGLTAWLAAEGITLYQSVPTVFRHWVETLTGGEQLPQLRLIHLGGEPVSRRDVEAYQKHFSTHSLLLNNLGSTEVYSYRQFFMDGGTRLPSSLVPVGYALDDKEVLILDEAGQPLGPGAVGEIAVRSRYLTPGYWRRPDLDAAFEPAGADGLRLFHTGDLGRLEADGCLYQLGRRDSQVKINGWRVELAEVEMALLEHPAIKEAAVMAEEAAGGSALVAYLAPRQGAPPSYGELRAFLQARLLEAMVPAAYVVLPALPYLPNGKLDRRALAAAGQMRLLPATDGEHAPQTPLEATLSALWGEVLGLTAVSRTASFFELGGHSLLSMQLVSRMETALGRPLPATILVQHPTIAQLAQALAVDPSSVGAPDLAEVTTLVPLQPHGLRPPLFLMPGFGGGALDYGELAQLLGAEQPVYGLLAQGHDGRLPPHKTIELLAAHAVEVIRAAYPSGPYHLGGYSFGGTVAYEAACQLQRQGQRVGLVAILDGYAPRRSRQPGGLRARLRRLRAFTTNLPLWLVDYARLTRAHGWAHTARLLRQLRTRLRPGARIDLRDVVEAPETLPEHTRTIMALHLRASRTYQPAPYAGPLTLLRIRSQSLTHTPDPERGWGPLAGGGVTVRYITGSHYNILMQPHVQSLAEALRASLAQAGG